VIDIISIVYKALTHHNILFHIPVIFKSPRRKGKQPEIQQAT
jgi:hypothetical protein